MMTIKITIEANLYDKPNSLNQRKAAQPKHTQRQVLTSQVLGDYLINKCRCGRLLDGNERHSRVYIFWGVGGRGEGFNANIDASI